MLRGDISNESPARWMVTLDCLLRDGSGLPKKGLFTSWERAARSTAIEPIRLGKLWQAAGRYGLQFELVVFGLPLEYCEALEQEIDRFGNTPIRWVAGYLRRKELASSLAYRPDVRGVVDTKEHALTWGSRGISLDAL